MNGDNIIHFSFPSMPMFNTPASPLALTSSRYSVILGLGGGDYIVSLELAWAIEDTVLNKEKNKDNFLTLSSRWNMYFPGTCMDSPIFIKSSTQQSWTQYSLT